MFQTRIRISAALNRTTRHWNTSHFLRVTAPYREELVVAVECSFTGYWLSALCTRQGLAFVLGHALYRKALHGGKAKEDKLDSHKIAVVLRGGMRPRA